MIRVLLIGPLPPPMGGDTRHFATLAMDLAGDERFQVRLVNTSRGQEFMSVAHNVRVGIKSIVATLRSLPGADVVSYHASDRGMLSFGPLVIVLSKLARKPTILRFFGGSFGDYYHRQGAFKKAFIRRYLLSSNVILLQTRRLIGQLQGQATGRLEWFSTYIRSSRETVDRASQPLESARTCKRFVFLGHLWRNKGVDTILAAARDLPSDVIIDMYGPLDEYTADDILARGAGRVHYRGLLTHEQVDERLWQYDCLVLPTYHPGEGYPGVIAEAFAHGLPVITTRWLAIPEIVDERCGILIEPKDSVAFAAAVSALHSDADRWRELSLGALSRAADFDHAVWSRKFEEICECLVHG